MIHSKLEQAVKDSPIFRKLLPASFFTGGVVWDSVTLGKIITSIDLWILCAYYLSATVALLVLARNMDFRYSERIPLLLQFLFGSLFSALVVLYFKSSGSLGAYVCVAFLVAFLVLNEFLKESYKSISLPLVIHCLCGIMCLNFLVPHMVNSIHPAWFYISTGIGFGVAVILWLCSGFSRSAIVPPALAACVLIVFFMFHLIPPVPLVLKQQFVGHDFSKTGKGYAFRVEKMGALQTLGLKVPELHFGNGEPVWCMTSVFAPDKVKAGLEHRWWIWNPEKKAWVNTDILPFNMEGGRKDGWRFYSRKSNISDGLWKIETALRDGPILGFHTFSIITGDPAHADTLELTYLK